MLALSPAAKAAGTITGTVTDLASPPNPVQGAVVTVAASGAPPLPPVTTGADGAFSVSVPDGGPFSVGVRAGRLKSQSIPGQNAGASIVFALAESKFVPLPVFAGRGGAVADAASGIFYANIGFAPEVYRTLDYGGSWQPVTMSYDDLEDGLRNTVQHDAIATSSVPGEVAVAHHLESGVTFSKDFGLTWDEVGGEVIPPPADPLSGGRGRQLWWGHGAPGAPSVLVVARKRIDGGWDVWTADMSVPAPGFVRQPSEAFGLGSEIAVADSLTGSFVGRVNASGELHFAPLPAAGTIAFEAEPQVTGLPTPPLTLALGGVRAQAAPPAGALVLGGSGPHVAQMLTRDPAEARFTAASASAATTLPDYCNLAVPPRTGTVAPTSAGASGAAQLGQCWLRKNGAEQLAATFGFPHSQVAFDARWGQGNDVAFVPGAPGLMKAARVDPQTGAPVPVNDKPADAGAAPESGGLSVNGITSPDVRDTDYGPAGSSQLAVGLEDLIMASRDGGATMVELLPRGLTGSRAVAWWQGDGRTWLAFGHGRCEAMLTAFADWGVAGTPSLAQPNVTGSSCTDLGSDGVDGNQPGISYQVGVLEGVPGTDQLFIATNHPTGGSSRIYRGRLSPAEAPAVALTRELDIGAALSAASPPIPIRPAAALAYCSGAPSTHAGLRDVLLIAFGGGPDQSREQPLVRVTGATGPSPVAASVASVGHAVADVRAHCPSGVVYAGGQGPHVSALSKSVDGGMTFSPVDLQQLPFITAVGLDPAAACAPPTPACAVRLGALGGAIIESTDGGGSWTVVNDPAVDRPIGIHDIEFPDSAAAAPSRARIAAVRRSPAGLVGTASGVYKGSVAVTAGVIALRGGPAGVSALGAQVSDHAADGSPTLDLAGSGGTRTTVFHRANGLYVSASAGGTQPQGPQVGGAWTPATRIPQTAGADRHPSTVLDPAGSLTVAFARSGAGGGIHVITRSPAGTWSAPRRVTANPGDTLPALVRRGGRLDIVFLRASGRGRGILHASARGGRFAAARRVPGTGAADAVPALGGPALAAHKARLELAFARQRGRGRRGAGIYQVSARGGRWGRLGRLTRVRGDARPALVVRAGGERLVVFRRPRRGLFELRGGRRWKVARLRGTQASDTDPALHAAGRTLLLAFARPSGTAPGIHVSAARGRRARFGRPVRWSARDRDRNPVARANAAGGITLVFERG